MQLTHFLLLSALFFTFSCAPSQEKKEELKTIPKPSYTIDLDVWIRRDATSAHTWKNIKNNAQVHYGKHNPEERFRLYKTIINPKDTVFEYLFGGRILRSYCKNKLVEENIQRPISGYANEDIYAGKNGMLKCVEREEIFIKVYYRIKNDTINKLLVDSMRYEIILDN